MDLKWLMEAWEQNKKKHSWRIQGKFGKSVLKETFKELWQIMEILCVCSYCMWIAL